MGLQGGGIMLAVNYTTLRENMKTCFDEIADSCEPMIVTRKNKNMVIMSQDYYDSMMETVYLLNNPKNQEHLERSITQHRKGMNRTHELLENGENL